MTVAMDMEVAKSRMVHEVNLMEVARATVVLETSALQVAMAIAAVKKTKLLDEAEQQKAMFLIGIVALL